MSVSSMTPTNPGRRRSIQAGLAGTAAVLTSARITTPVHAKDPPPPRRTTPFVAPLPVYQAKQPVATLTPPAGEFQAAGEAVRVKHEHWALFPPQKLYELDVGPAQHSFHPELPTQTIWGYDRMFPGPTFVERYGVPVVVRIRNNIPIDSQGPGAPEISTHLHNLHCASQSDGFPGDFFRFQRDYATGTMTGGFRDHHYPNAYAGFLDPRYAATKGDKREALGTLWYHDHCLHFTGPNVYRGLAGFYLLFDEYDNGDEKDMTSTTHLRLPSGVGKYDIPLCFNDPRVDSSGYVVFDQFENDGHLGNVFCVNGKIQPYFKVERRKYRFRALNGSIARLYEFYLTDKNGVNQTFTYIGNDGNLLPNPLFNQRKLALAPAERGDFVIDFSKYPLGTQLFVVDRLIQKDGRAPEGPLINIRGADGMLIAPGVQVMRFDIDSDPPYPDVSRVPSMLRPLPPVTLSEVVKERSWEFDRENEIWTINGKVFDVTNDDDVAADIKRGTAEIWRLKGKGSWVHPVHIHMEEGRILSRNGRIPEPHERGRKDVFVLNPGEEVRIFIRFRDFTGKYVAHCHNLTHEDHEMMMRFDIGA